MTIADGSIKPVRRRKVKSAGIYPLIFLSPFFIGLIMFNLLPILFTFIISFTKWDGFTAMNFVGFSNYYRMLFQDTRFFKTLYNTFLIMIMSMPVCICMALFISYLLSSKYMVLKKFFQVFNFMPYITTPVAIGIIWALLFDWKYGLINYVLQLTGIVGEPVHWLGKPMFARVVLALVVIWKNYGYLIIMFVAGMSIVPDELYEASTIDGANSMQKFFKITLPLLKGIIIFVVITGIISGLQLFDEPFLLFKGGMTGAEPFGGPNRACLTMSMLFYDTAFQTMDYGFGAAISYGMFVVISVFSFLSLKVMTRGEN